MACERNRVIELTKYCNKLGITINTGKNKARGNKGFFRTDSKSYRIDISKDLPDSDKIRVLLHELVHYIHFVNDKSLKSLNFIFNNPALYEADLLKLTVDSVPKSFAQELFNQKNSLKSEIKNYTDKIKREYPDANFNDLSNNLKKEISKSDLKYLLKYDAVKILSGFSIKKYELDNLEKDFPNTKQSCYDYLRLCSLKRNLNRINSKISRLNRYYNSPTELLARSFEYFIFEPDKMKLLTPKLYEYYENIIKKNDVKLLSDIVKIFEN